MMVKKSPFLEKVNGPQFKIKLAAKREKQTAKGENKPLRGKNKKAGENPTFRCALTASTSVVNHRSVEFNIGMLFYYCKKITFI